MSPSSPSTHSSASREAARQLRLEHERQTKRSQMMFRWGIVAAVLAVLIGIVAVIITQTKEIPTTGSAPAHGNEHGGITLSSPTELTATEPRSVSADAASEQPTGQPAGISTGKASGPAQVVAWVDVNCVHCANFETTYSPQIEQWLEDGKITMEYRTVSFLDRNSNTAYSSRAANALACVADAAPASYLPFTRNLYANYPDGELTNDELAALADASGAGDVTSCLDEGTFRPWVDYSTAVAKASGISGTPTVYVDGTQLESPADFEQAVQAAIERRNA
jgi:protein-disulfide isomerase